MGNPVGELGSRISEEFSNTILAIGIIECILNDGNGLLYEDSIKSGESGILFSFELSLAMKYFLNVIVEMSENPIRPVKLKKRKN